jgi:hypothetical protein
MPRPGLEGGGSAAEPYVYCLLEAGVPASLGRLGRDSDGRGEDDGEDDALPSGCAEASLVEVRRETALGGMVVLFVVEERSR